MTDTASNTIASSKTPEFIAYHVRDREGKKAIWTRVGSAWRHADGKGFNLQVDVLPLDGRVTLRAYSDEKE